MIKDHNPYTNSLRVTQGDWSVGLCVFTHSMSNTEPRITSCMVRDNTVFLPLLVETNLTHLVQSVLKYLLLFFGKLDPEGTSLPCHPVDSTSLFGRVLPNFVTVPPILTS